MFRGEDAGTNLGIVVHKVLGHIANSSAAAATTAATPRRWRGRPERRRLRWRWIVRLLLLLVSVISPALLLLLLLSGRGHPALRGEYAAGGSAPLRRLLLLLRLLRQHTDRAGPR